MSTSVVVNVDPTILVRLATYVAELEGKQSDFHNECSKKMQDNEVVAVISLLIGKSQTVFQSTNASGNIFHCICHLLLCIRRR